MKKTAVLMGSDSDLAVMAETIKTLREFGMPFEAHIMSAHRTPGRAARFAADARQNGFGVVIAAAGKAAHLAGAIAAHTTLPVIGVPIGAQGLGGLDSLLSTAQMPPGVPVATVAVDGARNAAVLAAQILAVGDEALAETLEAFKSGMEESVMKKDEKLQKEIDSV
ncbi:MAG: 5-(carboxyamino)imidazole ribonucleotide mutase [Oscillospiraceae bacterium]|jgi:5-(carboxyamino)imidazole ribonucleotide mutase|nr:5-(carboxyamino)imidazole ribonucleotide mutase [Oscillospiraceae bacterium]